MSEWNGGHAAVNMSPIITNTEPSPNRKPFVQYTFAAGK